MRPWIIYYADGSTFSSKDGSWEEAPQDGVIAVKQFKDETMTHDFHVDKDFYVMIEDGQINSFNELDLKDYIRRVAPKIKIGKWITDTQYRAVLEKARLDEQHP